MGSWGCGFRVLRTFISISGFLSGNRESVLQGLAVLGMPVGGTHSEGGRGRIYEQQVEIWASHGVWLRWFGRNLCLIWIFGWRQPGKTNKTYRYSTVVYIPFRSKSRSGGLEKQA